MKDHTFDSMRRWFLKAFLKGSVLAVGIFPVLTRFVLAMDNTTSPEGMRKVEGDVKINNAPASEGSVVNYGDLVTTGKNSTAIFVLDQSVYLLREDTRMEVTKETNDAKQSAISVLRVISGKVLSVFNRGEKQVMTSSAIIGVRGSGMYVEADENRTYCCFCYGKFDLADSAREIRKSIVSKHHETAVFMDHSPEGVRMTEAPMINHTDAELILLESLVGRTPPFKSNNQNSYEGYKKDN